MPSRAFGTTLWRRSLRRDEETTTQTREPIRQRTNARKMIIQFSVLLLSIRMLLGVHLSCSMQRCWPRGFVSGTEASLLLADCGRCHPIENFEKRFAWMAIRCIEIVGWKLLVDDAVQQMATNNWVCRIALMTQTRNKKKSPSFECPVSNGHSNFEASVYGPNRSTYYELS